MPTCGSCKQRGQTVEHVKACYEARRRGVTTVELQGAAKRYVEQFRPMALRFDDLNLEDFQ